MVFTRHPANPLLSPADVAPSRPDFEVIGVFNAGVARCGSDVILLLRVAERPRQTDADRVAFPYLQPDGQLTVHTTDRAGGRYDLSDERVVVDTHTGDTFLTSISHLRLARSADGVHFTVDSQPWLLPQPPYESFGVEDARITPLDGRFYVNYSAVSPLGIATALASTQAFEPPARHGVIFPPSNRDVTIFPARIDGCYVCYHRPMPSPFGSLNIWLARSSDLRRWGDHQLVLQTAPDGWESGRVGGGAPPILTPEGWLSIYHAADRQHRYCLGAFLTPPDAPERVIRRSARPVLWPQASYEAHGFFGNVVFTCGALLEGDVLRVYYGAADACVALAEAPLSDVLAHTVPVG